MNDRTDKPMDDSIDEIFEELFERGILTGLAKNPLDAMNSKAQAKRRLQALLVRAELQARINLVEYYDQNPTNESMDWKGLFADNRQQLKYELEQLKGGE